ncbi:MULTISPECIES: hypothetical protein [unclassified Streptomyces]|uniref:hypothetical protein n=1 Tax=unclassified Streptomyces TaxID=2593676 RepID=UPI00340612E4
MIASSPVARQGRPNGGVGGFVTLVGVNPKTRNRIMAGVLVLMFVVVAVAAARG